MSDVTFTSRRITRIYRQTINALPQAVFPLLCPVCESDWLDGWRYRMIHSSSGLVEPGAVFVTPGEGEEDTVWIVTRHDAEEGVVALSRFTPGSRTCLLNICVRENGGESSFVDISYTYTSIAPAGNAFLEGFTEEAFLDAMTFWERSMNHYLSTGQRLRRPSPAGG